jgi:hypothetical protein
MILIIWPFIVWGLDLVRKLLPTPGGFDHLFVMIDKFTKWIEAKPVAIASSKMAVEFIKEIINQYGVMNTIITNNGTQFACILQGLKPRIFRKLKNFQGRWVKELRLVLWGLRTTPTRPMGFTPFFLIYDIDAVLPKEISYASPRVRAYDEDTAEEALQDSVNRLDEHCRMALVRSVRY